ncbi:MAG: O-antigen ligase family protein [Deltaproteobacteria bacterium]|nr:O-antigen ligase family protein [Deltaproteobacteria bacterium]
MIPTASERAARSLVALALLTLVAVLFLVVEADAVERFARYHLPKELALLSGATVLAALALARGPRALDIVDGAALATVGAGLLACVGAVDADVAARGALLSGGGAAVFFALRSLGTERRSLADGIALIVVVSALVVLGEAVGLVSPIGARGTAPGGFLGQRNNAAHVFAITAPLLFDRAVRAEGARRALGALGLSILVAAVLVTRSRAAWIALGTGTTCALLLAAAAAVRAPASRRGLVLALAAVALGALVLLAPAALRWTSPRPYRETAQHLVDTATGSGRGRLVQARTTLALVREAPLLGIGPGHWAVHYPRVAAPGDPTVAWASFQPTGRLLTNDALALVAERGVVGVLPLLALAMLLLWRRARDEAWVLPCAATLGVLVLLDSVLQTATGLCVTALLAAAAVPRPEHGRTGRLAPVAAALLLVGSLGGAWRAADRMQAQRAMAQARSLSALADVARAHPAALAPRFTLAEQALFERDCARGAPWLSELRARRPFTPRIVEAAASCAIDEE